MRNNFVKDLLLLLDMKYDGVVYDNNLHILTVTVNKKLCFKDLDDLMNDLSKEIIYPLLMFRSDNDTYTFTYDLMMEK